MIRKSRVVVALAALLALGLSGTAVAQEPAVNLDGKVGPKKLPAKQFTNAKMFAQVSHDNADGSPGVPKPTKALRIDFGRNVLFRPNRPRKCTANIAGTSTSEVRALCPAASIIGQGAAHVRVPGPLTFTDLTTLAVAGPGKNQIRFHAYSPTLGTPVTQVIQGTIRENAAGKAYGWRLNVPEVPAILGGTGANTLFGVTISRASGVVQARCAAKRFLWKAQWTFTDDSKKSAQRSQPCQRK